MSTFRNYHLRNGNEFTRSLQYSLGSQSIHACELRDKVKRRILVSAPCVIQMEMKLSLRSRRTFFWGTLDVLFNGLVSKCCINMLGLDPLGGGEPGGKFRFYFPFFFLSSLFCSISCFQKGFVEGVLCVM